MRTKLIAIELVLLVLTGGFYVWSIQEEQPKGEIASNQDQLVYPNLQVNQIDTIELETGDKKLVLRRVSDEDRSTAAQQKRGQRQQKPSVQATLDTGPYRPDFEPNWVVESYHNYGVKKDLVKDRIINPMRELKRGELESTNKERRDEFGLDESNRRRIILRDDENKVIQDLVLGMRETAFTEAQPGPAGGAGSEQEFIYYYNNLLPEGEFQIRRGKSEFPDVPVNPQEWVHKDVLSFEEEDVPFVAVQNNEKLYVLLRKEQEQGSSDDGASDSDSGSDSSGDSSSDTDWQLYSGDFYSDTNFARNTPVLWKNNEIRWKGPQGSIQSVSLTERKLNQSKVNGFIRSLTSLEAESLEPPISIPAQQNRIPQEEKQKYGFSNNTPILYLGEWRKQRQVLLLRAKFYLGQTSEGNGGATYISSLKTANTAQKVMQQMFGLPTGGGQAEKLIPVYALSGTDLDAALSPENFVKKEEKDDRSGKDGGSESTSQDTSNEKEGSGESGKSTEDSSSSTENETNEDTSSTEEDSTSTNGGRTDSSDGSDTSSEGTDEGTSGSSK